jgi:hypothetical protein
MSLCLIDCLFCVFVFSPPLSLCPHQVPLYSILGISVTFALLFSIIDLLNYGCACMQDETSKPLIETETQVCVYMAPMQNVL